MKKSSEVLETVMCISGNCMTSWVDFGDKKKIFEILEKYLGVTPMGWDDEMPDEEKNWNTYRHPTKVKITATKGKIIIEKRGCLKWF